MRTPWTILAASRAIRLGDVTPLELVGDCLERINRLDSQVSAWVSVDAPGALRAAEKLSHELAGGVDRGPLHGIPLGIKDIIDVAGVPTRAGSPLTDQRSASQDAAVVERLRAAGAIILGKTVTTEFACFDPPPTRNPWDATRTPGGSSSGSAAALALGMCTGAIGSQTGGSITRPASYCGVAGCKPTFGRISRAGVVPVSFHLDHVGPLARTAADCAILLAAMTGDCPDFAESAQQNGTVPLWRWARSSPAQVSDHINSLSPPTLGVIRPFFFDSANAEVAELTRRAIESLRGQGARVVELSLPEGFESVHAMHRRIMDCEAADVHRARFGAPRAGYGPNMAALVAEGFAISMADYQEALRHQQAFGAAVARTLAGVDALVTPATPSAAPGAETTGDPRFNSPWSHAGTPTVSIPCALTQAGLPIALQCIGPPWSEAKLFDAAIWCEQKIGFSSAPRMLDA